MNFDRVAAPYRGLETIVFGEQLQEARTAFLKEIAPPRRVLAVGEGNGRFLAQFVRVHPDAAVDCVEASTRMVALARRAVGTGQVNFIGANLMEVPLEASAYDLIVTHFFLDCFDEESLRPVVGKLARAAAPGASWLIADFHLPPPGWSRLRARILIATMYCFFRAVAGIEARRLVDYRPLLKAEGFVLTKSVLSPNEIIRSEAWRRISLPG